MMLEHGKVYKTRKAAEKAVVKWIADGRKETRSERALRLEKPLTGRGKCGRNSSTQEESE